MALRGFDGSIYCLLRHTAVFRLVLSISSFVGHCRWKGYLHHTDGLILSFPEAASLEALAQPESSIRPGRTRRLQVLILEDNRWTLQAILGSVKFVQGLLGRGFLNEWWPAKPHCSEFGEVPLDTVPGRPYQGGDGTRSAQSRERSESMLQFQTS